MIRTNSNNPKKYVQSQKGRVRDKIIFIFLNLKLSKHGHCIRRVRVYSRNGYHSKYHYTCISFNSCQGDYDVCSENFLLVLGNPCRNGGIVVSSQFGYHCLCSRDYHGRFCDGMERAMYFLSENIQQKTRKLNCNPGSFHSTRVHQIT